MRNSIRYVIEMLRNSLILLFLSEMFFWSCRPKGTEDVSAHSGILDFWMTLWIDVALSLFGLIGGFGGDGLLLLLIWFAVPSVHFFSCFSCGQLFWRFKNLFLFRCHVPPKKIPEAFFNSSGDDNQNRT